MNRVALSGTAAVRATASVPAVAVQTPAEFAHTPEPTTVGALDAPAIPYGPRNGPPDERRRRGGAGDRRRAPTGLRGDDVDAGRREEGVGAVVAARPEPVVPVGRSDSHHVGVAGRVGRGGRPGVAGRCDDHGALRPGV